MSFNVNKQKRLARRNPIETSIDKFNRPYKKNATPKTFMDDPHLSIKESDLEKELTISPYSDKSFIVMGSGTHNHSDNLTTLGGKLTPLRIGLSWLYPKFKQESVQHYIDTGEVKPYVYSQADRDRFQRRNDPDFYIKQKLREIFKEFRDAFDIDEDYEGISIINVIDQLEEKHLGVQKITCKPRLSKEEPSPPEPEESNSLSSEELSSEESE